MRKRDPQGLYAALDVSPDASRLEIEMAYSLLRDAHASGQRTLDLSTIQLAYDTLDDPVKREHYDAGPVAGDGRLQRGRTTSRLHSVPLLVTLALMLLGVLAVALGPRLAARSVRFEPGSELYWKETGRPLGSVVEYAETHAFENGSESPAYRIQLRSGGEPVWFAAPDLNLHCKVR